MHIVTVSHFQTERRGQTEITVFCICRILASLGLKARLELDKYAFVGTEDGKVLPCRGLALDLEIPLVAGQCS